MDLVAARVTGHCTFTSAGSMEPKIIKDGDTLSSDVTINCPESSSLVLISVDGVSAQLGPTSRLKIDALGSSRVHGEWTLETGEIVVKVRALVGAPPPKFILKTPGGQITTRYASFRVIWRPSSDVEATKSVAYSISGSITLENSPFQAGPTPSATSQPTNTGVGGGASAPRTPMIQIKPASAEDLAVGMTALQRIALAEVSTRLPAK